MCHRVSNYPWQEIDPKDFVFIESNTDLTMQDIRILTKLYKPIIGNAAYAFYQSLFSELDFKANQKMTTISKLIRKMDIGIAEFYQARIRLEALGLVKNYRSKDEDKKYIYELISPLSVRHFLEDSLLQALLIEQIGKRLFQEEIEDLVNPLESKENYEELTHSFIDVYHFDIQKQDLTENNQELMLNRPVENEIPKDIENIDSFDYSFFKKGLNKQFIRQDSLTKEIKELIFSYHIIYGIDELTMQSILLESADVESGKINKNKLTNTVQRMYLNQQKSDIKLQRIKEDNVSELNKDKKELKKTMAKKGFSSSEISVIQHAKAAAPAHYLRSIKDQKKGFVTSNEIWVLKELVEQSPLNKEVINILLHYILVIQKSVVLEKNYATKIANDWAQDNIKTAEEAVSKIKSIFKGPKGQSSKNAKQTRKKNYSRNYRRKSRTEILPDWAQADRKENQAKDTKEKKRNERVSKEDNDLRERLERIRSQRKTEEDS